MMEVTGRIVVGHDDSAASEGAVRWAARLAAALSRELCIVHAWTWPLLNYRLGPLESLHGGAPRNNALHLLDQAVRTAEREAPRARVTSELIEGDPLSVLTEISADADLLVVGTRGLGSVLGTLLGSVSRGVLHEAGCPVLIIRAEHHRAGPVMVAYDGSESGLRAVDLAADLAAVWRVPLKVVHAAIFEQEHPRSAMHARARAAPPAGATGTPSGDRGRRLLEDAAGRARARHAGLAVSGEELRDRSVPGALLDAATGARLLVLGHRGFSRDRFGSTAHATVLHATGNVAVVRTGPAPVD